ncbi:unnamed protein product [Diamesa tonsa]
MNQMIFVVLVLVFQIVSAENDATPEFKKCSEYSRHIVEGQKIGTLVVQVSAETVDDVDIEYSLLSNDRFTIHPISGKIKTNYVFDRDEPKNETSELIKVCATNKKNRKLKGICDIQIVIDDINDNPPIFQQKHYHSSVFINSTVNDMIFKVKATDIDDGENSKILYKIESHSFRIDNDGTIFLEDICVDEELGYVYNITVKAFNENKSSYFDNSLISLTVVDVYENLTIAQTSDTIGTLFNDGTKADEVKEDNLLPVHNTDNDEDENDYDIDFDNLDLDDEDEDSQAKNDPTLNKKDDVIEDKILKTTLKSESTTIAQTTPISMLLNETEKLDKDKEDKNPSISTQSSLVTIAQTTVKNSLMLSKKDDVNIAVTTVLKSEPTAIAQTTPISVLLNDTDTEGDKDKEDKNPRTEVIIAQTTPISVLLENKDTEGVDVNEDGTLTTTPEIDLIVDETPINLLNDADTKVDKVNDEFMNARITSDNVITDITKKIARFLMQDYYLIAIVALIIIIQISILVYRTYCFKGKRVSHDFETADNSLYFFGSEKRDSFCMVETKAMNDYEPSPKLQSPRYYRTEPKEEPMYQECAYGQNKNNDGEVYDHLSYNEIPKRDSKIPDEPFYKTPTSFRSTRIIFPDIHAKPTESRIPFCESSIEHQTPINASAPCYSNISINVMK